MISETTVAAFGCLTWGMISVLFSPCYLASIPLIAAYVGGQEQALDSKQAGVYSSAFTLGLFISIALDGTVCALLGRMLGENGLRDERSQT
jgi:cytochrome c-type biogenesis protein